MEYEMPIDQGQLEKDVDQLFKAADRAAFLILNEILGEASNVQETTTCYNTSHEEETS